MRRPPVHLDHPAVGAAVDTDPVAGPVGAAETEDDAGKDVAQRALQRQPEDDGDNAGGREQALNRHVEHVGDDREQRGEIDQPGEQILQQLPLARPALDDHKGAQKADQEPRHPQPPRDLQNRVGGVVPRDPGRLQRVVRDDARVQQRNRQQS